jgi:UbiD family decarboxylase
MSEAGFPSLRAFLERLRRDGDLAVVEAPVDARLEAAEIHRRVIAASGPALLFTRIEGADFPLVMNLYGTRRRAELAFGRRPAELVSRLARLAQEILPPTAGKLWGARDLLRAALGVGLRRRASGPVREVETGEPRLDRLPVLTCWPQDGGPFLTLPLVYTQPPQGGGHNLGIYRMQVHGPRAAGMHWQIGKGGGYHYAAAEARGEALPATVFLGGPPALTLAAVAPLPENVPELVLASLLLGRKLAVCPAPGGHPHPLIAEAEFALLGRVAAHRRQPEGPFGDHYGYYSLRHDYPVFELERLLHRRDAIYPATVVGKPRQEDFYIGDLLQELLAPLFPLVMPGVRDLWSYGETGYHSLAAAVVRERFAREALVSGLRILGEGQLALTKFLLLTDSPVDLRDFRATLEHLLARSDPSRDLYVLADTSMDTLDYTGPRVNEGSKGIWLGLGAPRRELARDFRPPVEPPAGVSAVRVFCGGCLVVGGPPHADDPGFAARCAAHPAFAGWPLLVVTDEPERAAKSAVNFLWTTFTRFEPAADLHPAARRVDRNRLVLEPPIAIDARRKPGFPEELFCDAATAATVTRRWREYFPDRPVEMGDSGAAHLD